MGETRVNLKHLLEDIRDSYPCPLEEAILVELVANALDSGASDIQVTTSLRSRSIRIMDNGRGMTPKGLEEYHDIAASTKVRGKGIGFAGVGAKLALLLAESVVTETKSRDFHGATRWQLEGAQRAPWEFVDAEDTIDAPSGTAVTIFLKDRESPLLKRQRIPHMLQDHFYPILDDHFKKNILKYVYGTDVSFTINGRPMALSQSEHPRERIYFSIQLGRQKRPVGIGFVAQTKDDLAEGLRGIAVSTYGKVIKRGWDWLGITAKNPARLTGVVEIPALSELLTTNKADFLKDANSLQKYYRYRKAVQQAIEPVLRQLGEAALPRERAGKDSRPLEREVERVLGGMLNDFPELSPLMGRLRRGEEVAGIIPDPEAALVGRIAEGVDAMTGTYGGGGEGAGTETAPGLLPGERIEANENPTEPGQQHQGRRRRPGLMIGFQDQPEREDLAWLVENTVWVNTAHPAYTRASEGGAMNYHVILCVAWALSGYLEGERSPQDFVNRFLSVWGSRA